MNLDMMLKQWSGFCKKYGVNGNPEEFFSEIQGMYEIPKRYYHTFEGHVGGGLDDFEQFKNLAENPDIVYYSWLLHDSVQDIYKTDNEEKSADFAGEMAIRMGLPAQFKQASKELILATKHDSAPQGTDAKLIVCMDLLIFGKSPDDYDRYRKNIIKEYEDIIDKLSEKEFEFGRGGILVAFLDRKPIYPIESIRNIYEEPARQNVEREIKELGWSVL